MRTFAWSKQHYTGELQTSPSNIALATSEQFARLLAAWLAWLAWLLVNRPPGKKLAKSKNKLQKKTLNVFAVFFTVF